MSMKEKVLKQLLDELLSSTDDSAPVGHGVSPADLDINRQVIELIVNAGLLGGHYRGGESLAGEREVDRRGVCAAYDTLFGGYQGYCEEGSRGPRYEGTGCGRWGVAFAADVWGVVPG
jgi:hypothetical protein